MANHSKATGSNRALVRLLVVVLSFFIFCGFSQVPRHLLHLPGGPMTIGALFDSIEHQLDTTICWKKGLIDINKIVNVPAIGTIDEVLAPVMNELGLTIQRVHAQISIKKMPAATAKTPPPATPDKGQSFTITVLSEKEERVGGSTVILNDSGRTMIADDQGMVSIKKNWLPLHITITHIGMATMDTFLSKGDPVVYHLRSTASALDEELVLGYARTTNRLSTGTISVVSQQQLDNVASGTLQTSLEGLVPGLLVTQSTGFTNGSVYLNIRGQSSIFNGRAPLYVIDGVLLASGDQSVSNLPAIGSSATLTPFSFIDPSEIQEIEILKDADATAIYGSRGANGVVLITTKHGQSGQRHFDLRFSNAIDQVTKRVSLMNTSQYLSMRSEAFNNDHLNMTAGNAPDLLSWDKTRYTDWGKWAIGGIGHIYNLRSSLSGGGKNDTYYIGLNGLQDQSFFPTNPVHQRINSHFNYNHRSVNNKLNLQVTGLFDRDDNNQFLFTDPAKLQFLAPNTPALKDANGNPVFLPDSIPFLNPWYLLRQPYKAISYNFLANALGTYKIWPSLTAKMTLGWNDLHIRETGKVPGSPLDTNSIDYSATTHYKSLIAEPQIEFRKDYRRLHLTALGGASWQQENNGMHNLTAFTFLQLPDSASDTYIYKALFGRVNFNWGNTYILNLTARRDGSNRLDTHIRYSNFFAAGAIWIISNESWFRKTFPAVSFGKLRASYGTTGNDQIGAHTLDTWTPGGIPLYQNIPGFSTAQVSSGRSWELVKKTDLSMQLGFAKNKILFTVDWYRNRSSNQLIPTTYPTAGTNAIYENIPAVLENKGWEFELMAKLFSSDHFGWSITLNASLPSNRLVSFSGLAQSPYAKTLLPGQSLNTVQAYRYLSVDKSTGIYQFQDMNHDGKITSSADMTIVGKLDVTAFGGIQNSIRYKNFQLDLLFDARKKTGIDYNTALYIDMPPGSLLAGMYSNFTTALTDRWRKPGDNASFQQVSTDTSSIAGKAIANYISSSALLKDASFIRLRKLSLNYHLPQSLLTRAHLAAASIYLMAQNLFSLSPYKGADSEIQNAEILPTLRTIEMGFHIVI